MQFELSFTEYARRSLYFDMLIQVGGGKRIPVTASTFRPLTWCSSGELNFFENRERAKNIMDISPPIFFWLSRGLRGWTLSSLFGVGTDIAIIREKGQIRVSDCREIGDWKLRSVEGG